MQILEFFDRLLSTPILVAGTERISLLWILKLILSLIIVMGFTTVCKRFLRDYLLLQLKFSQGSREAVSTLISYSLGALGFLIVLSVNGLNIASLAVVLGGLGVGIGFGLQDLTKNLVSGLALLLEGKLQVGDYVEFDGLAGHIKEISMRSTIIETFDGGDIVAPNSKLVSNEVLNWSYRDRKGKLHLLIRAAYNSDPTLVTEVLLNSAYMEPAVLYDPPPRVIFKGFGESALEFDLWVWVNRIDEGISVRSSLNYIIDHNFRLAGLQIPFPQRELWFRKLEERSPKLLTDSSHHAISSNNGASTPSSTPTPLISIRQVLKQVYYFQQTSDLSLRKVIEAGYRKMLSPGEELYHEGETPVAVYIVLSGVIEIVSIGLNKRLNLHQVGTFFGETAILLGVDYIATARSIGETIVFVIPKQNFEKLLTSCPKLAETFAEETSKQEEYYNRLRQQLEAMGLLNMVEHDHSFVGWVQDRLEQLFKLSHTGHL